jgi:hypothetical protein
MKNEELAASLISFIKNFDLTHETDRKIVFERVLEVLNDKDAAQGGEIGQGGPSRD